MRISDQQVESFHSATEPDESRRRLSYLKVSSDRFVIVTLSMTLSGNRVYCDVMLLNENLMTNQNYQVFSRFI